MIYIDVTWKHCPSTVRQTTGEKNKQTNKPRKDIRQMKDFNKQ